MASCRELLDGARDILHDCDPAHLLANAANTLVNFGLIEANVGAQLVAGTVAPEAVRLENAEILQEILNILTDQLLTNGYPRAAEAEPAPEPPQNNNNNAAAANNNVPQAAPVMDHVERQVSYLKYLEGVVLILPSLFLQQYNAQANDLLMNEFKWFYTAAINSFYLQSGRNYTAARQLVLQVIKPYIGDFDPSTINPLLPGKSIPFHLIRTL